MRILVDGNVLNRWRWLNTWYKSCTSVCVNKTILSKMLSSFASHIVRKLKWWTMATHSRAMKCDGDLLSREIASETILLASCFIFRCVHLLWEAFQMQSNSNSLGLVHIYDQVPFIEKGSSLERRQTISDRLTWCSILMRTNWNDTDHLVLLSIELTRFVVTQLLKKVVERGRPWVGDPNLPERRTKVYRVLWDFMHAPWRDT